MLGHDSEVDPLECPRCGGQTRVLALIEAPAVTDKIPRHLLAKGRDTRGGPWLARLLVRATMLSTML